MKKMISGLVALAMLFPCLTNLTAMAQNPEDLPFVGFYGGDPETFDYLYTYKHSDSRHFANFIDGLIEHDAYGNLVGAMATDWHANEDATVWTFDLRQGVDWYTDEGLPYAPVTADDFVAGLQHAADFQSQTLYLVTDLIKNLDEYTKGLVSFEEVGIKALDDYTLEYTLKTPTPYFPTLTTYSILLPVNRQFLESQGPGNKLGSPDFATAGFGRLAPESILYNGPYLLKNLTSKSVMEYEANPGYWDYANVHVKNIKLLFSGNTDPSNLFLAFDRGEIVSAPIDVNNPSIVSAARKKYGDSIFVTDTNAAVIFATFVLNRTQYHSPVSATTDVSPKNEKEREDTKAAILNPFFRQAILRAVDTSAINGQYVGTDLKYTSLRNMLTQPGFVKTSDYKGYGQLVENHLKSMDAGLYPGDFSLEDGQMAFYDPALAKGLMEKAKTQLKDAGADFPVQLDVLVNGESEMSFRGAQAFKHSVEQILKGDVAINLVVSTAHHFLAQKNHQAVNTDIYFATAWSPDYGDPKSYLDILDPYNGDLLKNFGLQQTGEQGIKEESGLVHFKQLKDLAAAEATDLDLRYDLYAKAEAYAINQAYFIPLYASGGSYAVSRIVPYTKPYSAYGLSDMKFKGMRLSPTIITSKERDVMLKHWQDVRNGLV
ncbi:MAG: peptide ABC transporter substrate-binding protein [Turicibacter sp.]|nr:peptide ABC transporter substrate-binding protein [Turicibacter sp.]